MIKNLRMMRRGVDITVVVGHNKYGGDVTANLTFQRSELEEVLAPLEQLAYQEAIRVLGTSVSQKEVDERVAREVVAGVASTKKRLATNARSLVENALKGIEEQLVLDRTVIGDSTVEGVPNWRVQAIRKRIETAREQVAATFKVAS